MQYEFILSTIRTEYKSSDIQLNISIVDHKTVLNFTGTVVTLNDDIVDYQNEIICDYLTDNIINKRN